MNREQTGHALITYFVARYTAVHNKPPLINRYKEKWGFLDMLDDLGYDRSKQVIDYYLTTNLIDHPLIHLFRNYERLAKLLIEQAEDERRRAELREETKERVEAWRLEHGSDRTGSP